MNYRNAHRYSNEESAYRSLEKDYGKIENEHIIKTKLHSLFCKVKDLTYWLLYSIINLR